MKRLPSYADARRVAESGSVETTIIILDMIFS